MADNEKLVIDQLEEKVLVRWNSLERPYKERSRDFYSTVLVLAVLVGIIFFFIEGIMPVLLTAAVVFFVFVTGRVKPGVVENVITNTTLRSGRASYPLEKVMYFWVDFKNETGLINFRLSEFPFQIVMVLPSDKKEIEKIVATVGGLVEMVKPTVTNLDKTIGWIEKKLPLDG